MEIPVDQEKRLSLVNDLLNQASLTPRVIKNRSRSNSISAFSSESSKQTTENNVPIDKQTEINDEDATENSAQQQESQGIPVEEPVVSDSLSNQNDEKKQ